MVIHTSIWGRLVGHLQNVGSQLEIIAIRMIVKMGQTVKNGIVLGLGMVIRA